MLCIEDLNNITLDKFSFYINLWMKSLTYVFIIKLIKICHLKFSYFFLLLYNHLIMICVVILTCICLLNYYIACIETGDRRIKAVVIILVPEEW